MSEERIFLDDIYASKKSEGSTFKAVVMMAHEARFINEQARMGFIELEKKPTTIAMYKFKQNRLEMVPAPTGEMISPENAGRFVPAPEENVSAAISDEEIDAEEEIFAEKIDAENTETDDSDIVAVDEAEESTEEVQEIAEDSAEEPKPE